MKVLSPAQGRGVREAVLEKVALRAGGAGGNLLLNSWCFLLGRGSFASITLPVSSACPFLEEEEYLHLEREPRFAVQIYPLLFLESQLA